MGIPTLVKQIREEGIELDDPFFSVWGSAYLQSGQWRKCLSMMAKENPRFERTLKHELGFMFMKLKKSDRIQEILDFFHFFESSAASAHLISGRIMAIVIQ